jgi:hypothetical protein
MSDIVERLPRLVRRLEQTGRTTAAALIKETAAEIARLRDANAALERERDALRGALERVEFEQCGACQACDEFGVTAALKGASNG